MAERGSFPNFAPENDDKPFKNMQTNRHIILASNSPRRKELLAALGYEFTIRTLAGIDEHFPPELGGEAAALHIAEKKATAYRATLQADELLITADTVVCLNGTVMGKPANRADAIRMLTQLSGCTHQVHTAVCVLSTQKTERFVSTTAVSFRTLAPEEIAYYVDHYQPMDKAGAYGIQEWIGHIGVTSIQGSYYNVMGLPTQELYETLKSF